MDQHTAHLWVARFDEDGNVLTSFEDLRVSFTSKGASSTSAPPAITLDSEGYPSSEISEWAKQLAPGEPVPSNGTFAFPLEIDGNGYLLDDTTNTLVPQTVTAGDGSMDITFTAYTQKDLAHFTLYLNLQDDNTDYADSDTYITYTSDGTTVVTNPHGYIADATITVMQEDDRAPEKKTVRITIEFGDEPMGPTNMVAYMWNTDRKAVFVRVIDALDVVALPPPQEPEMQEADPEPVPADTMGPGDYDEAQVLSLIRMWSGFESEMITDEQLLTSLGLDYPDADIPDWVMTELGVLAAKGDVTIGEFMLALQYVLEHT